MPSLSFAPELLEELARHAEACYPRECCGALLGHRGTPSTDDEGAARGDGSGRVVEVVACGNAASDPLRRYAIAPRELFELHRAARRAGLEVIGYYHSHPTRDASPSATDREESWPELSYVIIPVGDGRARQPRCWRFSSAGEPLEERIFAAATPSDPESES